jgi:hypothetical protein
MDRKIEKIKKIREFLLDQIAGLTAGQLNKIPEGFNNNIIWNLGHMICAEQTICYFRAGQPFTVDEKYISLYKTTTRPVGFVDEHEIEKIKELLISTIGDLQTDVDRNIFENYVASENILRVYGIELKTIDDALDYLIYHEGLHSGHIISLKRLVC